MPNPKGHCCSMKVGWTTDNIRCSCYDQVATIHDTAASYKEIKQYLPLKLFLIISRTFLILRYLAYHHRSYVFHFLFLWTIMHNSGPHWKSQLPRKQNQETAVEIQPGRLQLHLCSPFSRCPLRKSNSMMHRLCNNSENTMLSKV